MRIGILGGSFDPPHFGHLEMAKATQEFLNLDTILFVPAAIQWQKQHTTPADVRAHMTQLAISNNPDWQVSLVDIDRGGDTYSIETISTLRKIYPEDELFFILGSDAANSLDKWHKAEALKDLITFAVVERFGVALKIPDGFQFIHVPGKISAISSSEIRNLVRNNDASETQLQQFTTREVSKYIATIGLYK